ncbi:MAG: DUF4272 domain-containing protein [Cyanobacteria bacterium P01_A01_bin.3]
MNQIRTLLTLNAPVLRVLAVVLAGLMGAWPSALTAYSQPTAEERREGIEALENNLPTPEQAERKQRSLAILEAEGVPYLETLPVIESEENSEIRPEEDVEFRALCLVIVAAKGEGVEQAVINQLVEDYGLAKYLTPDERAFIDNANPTQQQRIDFLWRYESAWVMMWALGFLDELPRPDTIADVPQLVGIVRDNSTESFQEAAQLRPAAELLDRADLIYRYNWAVTDARINGREAPANLNGSVVYERHYSLNWLIGYFGQDWDDVSTDT